MIGSSCTGPVYEINVNFTCISRLVAHRFRASVYIFKDFLCRIWETYSSDSSVCADRNVLFLKKAKSYRYFHNKNKFHSWFLQWYFLFFYSLETTPGSYAGQGIYCQNVVHITEASDIWLPSDVYIEEWAETNVCVCYSSDSIQCNMHGLYKNLLDS